MIKTEMMKRFEEETDKQSAYPKLCPYDYDMEYLAWLEAKADAYDRLINMNSVSKHDIKIVLDGHAWYAYRIPFRNLQEDNAGFGATPQIALTALLESELPDGWEEACLPKQGI